MGAGVVSTVYLAGCEFFPCSDSALHARFLLAEGFFYSFSFYFKCLNWRVPISPPLSTPINAGSAAAASEWEIEHARACVYV